MRALAGLRQCPRALLKKKGTGGGERGRGVLNVAVCLGSRSGPRSSRLGLGQLAEASHLCLLCDLNSLLNHLLSHLGN